MSQCIEKFSDQIQRKNIVIADKCNTVFPVFLIQLP